MSRIYVCPLSKVEETLRESGARTLVTLLNESLAPARPPQIAPARRLIVSISDIVEELEGHVLADDHHIEDLLRFAAAWDRRHPMVIHCYAGISRSTAAAFVVACALEPKAPESFFARSIRANSKTANPNTLLVALADQRLKRDGRMIAAIAAIGPAIPAAEGKPFSFALQAQPASAENG